MNGFIFSYPTKVYFGEGVAKKCLTETRYTGSLWSACRKDKERRR